jgi:5'-phosphate synthase pdxT subunit
LKIGVVAVQGAVSEHVEVLRKAMEKSKIEGSVAYARKVRDLDDVSGIVIPGGESTTISRLILSTGMYEKIAELAKKGLPILGTCAGTILLSKEGNEQVKQTNTQLLGLLEMKVLRNAYGRQVDSFEADVKIPEIGDKPFRAVFIRAPTIEKVWNDTRVWAEYKGTIIGARKGNILALTFHPELSDDLRIHKYFLKMTVNSALSSQNAFA